MLDFENLEKGQLVELCKYYFSEYKSIVYAYEFLKKENKNIKHRNDLLLRKNKNLEDLIKTMKEGIYI